MDPRRDAALVRFGRTGRAARRVIARATVVAEVDRNGVTRLTRLRSAAPLALRATPDALFLVGAAAGPLAGDAVALDVRVGPGAALTVRTAAASVVLAGAGPQPSTLHVDVAVAAGGTLHWSPEPTVATAGCFHAAVTRLVLEDGARLVWREEVILGRSGEQPGRFRSRTTLDIGGRPVVRQQLHVGADSPGWAGAAVLGGARAVGTLIVADPGWSQSPPERAVLGPTAVVLPLPGPAAQVSALAPDAVGLRASLEAGIRALEPAGGLARA